MIIWLAILSLIFALVLFHILLKRIKKRDEFHAKRRKEEDEIYNEVRRILEEIINTDEND